MKGISAEQALRLWEDGKLLTQDQARTLRAYLLKKSPGLHTNRGVTIFATIGAVLVGVGVLLFIGSNWSNMGPVARGVTLFAGYAAVVAAAYFTEKARYFAVAESLWFLSTILFGANIFLLAQIFNYSLTYWQGPFWWLVGAVLMGLSRRKAAYAVLAVPLVIFTLGWLGGGSGWFFDDELQFLWSDDGLRPIFPLMGVGFLCAGLLSRRFDHTRFASNTFITIGALFVALPLVFSTFDHYLLHEIFGIAFSLKQLSIIVGTFVLVILTLLFGDARTAASRTALIVLMAALIPLYVQRDGAPLLEPMLTNRGAFGVYVIAVFSLSLGAMWAGVMTQNIRLVNISILASALIIIGQYFSWSFLLLDRSIAFIIGGIVIIVLSVGIEKYRRHLVSRIAT